MPNLRSYFVARCCHDDESFIKVAAEERSHLNPVQAATAAAGARHHDSLPLPLVGQVTQFCGRASDQPQIGQRPGAFLHWEADQAETDVMDMVAACLQ